MENGNGDEMENENGDEGGDGDGDGDRDDLDQELPSWLRYPCAGTIPASTQHQTPLALFGHSGLQSHQPQPALHHKLSLGCTRALHGVENINCSLLLHFSII